MSIILNIDTSSRHAHVSVSKDGLLLNSVFNSELGEHASFLQPSIKSLLEAARLNLADLDAIAVVNGPGSYTGLRVALASAKGLCFVLQKPLICIGTLELMAKSALMAKDQGSSEYDLICPMIDARRMEVFTAVFNLTLQEILPPQAMVLTPEVFESHLAKQRILFFGSGAAKWQAMAANANALFATSFDSCAAMAMISHEQFTAANFVNLAYTEPFYLKEFYTGN